VLCFSSVAFGSGISTATIAFMYILAIFCLPVFAPLCALHTAETTAPIFDQFGTPNLVALGHN
jgi:hypothetical protein